VDTPYVEQFMHASPVERPARYDRSQREALLEFLRLAYGPGSLFAEERYVHWLYEEGGALLYLAWRNGRVVGQIGWQPSTVRANGRDVLVHWALNFIVLPEFRRLRVGEELIRARKQDRGISLTIDYTRAAHKVVMNVGGQDVDPPKVELIEAPPVYVRPLAIHGLSRRLGRWSAPLALLSMLPLRALDARMGARIRKGKYRLEQVAQFDERADRIWERSCKPYTVIGRRDAAALNWRFARYPEAGRYQLFHLMREAEVVGVVVLRTGGKNGVMDGFVVDHLCEPEHAPMLMACVVQWMKQQGAVAVYCLTGLAQSPGPLRENGFFRRGSGWPVIFSSRSPDAEANDLLRDARNWFLTYGESDIDRPR
jgi:hypothetical protein